MLLRILLEPLADLMILLISAPTLGFSPFVTECVGGSSRLCVLSFELPPPDPLILSALVMPNLTIGGGAYAL